MSSTDCVRLANTASNISVVTVRPASPSRYELRKRSMMYVHTSSATSGFFSTGCAATAVSINWRRSRSSCRSRIVRSTPSAARRNPNGSRVPVGFCPIAKMPASVSSLSASASAIPVRVSRNAIAGEARPVLLFERGADFGRFAVVLRVVLAHQALQLGEFADHQRQQIALAQLGGAARQRCIAADRLGDAHREAADALGLVVHRAELRLERHALQHRPPRFEPLARDRCPRRTPRPRAAAVSRARCRRELCPARGSRYWRRR